jgi:endonuclease/exonuclease/phosphatase (EEP) superfamily protein YafD
VILCGDFNDVPDSATCQRLSAQLLDAWSLVGQGDGFTIPAQQPRKRIDYLWVSKDRGLVPLKIRVPASEASDHRPVVGEFRWDVK